MNVSWMGRMRWCGRLATCPALRAAAPAAQRHTGAQHSRVVRQRVVPQLFLRQVYLGQQLPAAAIQGLYAGTPACPSGPPPPPAALPITAYNAVGMRAWLSTTDTSSSCTNQTVCPAAVNGCGSECALIGMRRRFQQGAEGETRSGMCSAASMCEY